MFKSTADPGFPAWVRAYLRQPPPAPPGARGAFALKRHQLAVTRFLLDTPYRGLLLYHGLGSGKSCAAIAAAAALGRRRVFVMLPASLRPSFEAEIAKCGRDALAQVIWVSTNGVSPAAIARGSVHGAPLDGACVVIDEVHNFISQVVNGGRRGRLLFDALFRARDLKLIALSGTPIVNAPFEIGMLLNLVSGPQTCMLLDGVAEDAPRLLRESRWVERVEVLGRRSLRVWRTPFPFARDAATGELFEPEGAAAAGGQAAEREVLELAGAVAAQTEARWLFPNSAEAFDAAFVDDARSGIRDAHAFAQRAVGLVSYFRMGPSEASASGFPTVRELAPVVLRMSDTQLEAYIQQRTVEIRLEIRAARGRDRAPANSQGETGVYRAFSRAVCNFAFDNTSPIKRIFPNSFRAMLREMDVPEEADADADAPAAPGTYDGALRETMAALERAPGELRGERLREHSPKFHAIVEALRRGAGEKALVYSQFRRVEGVGILAAALRANGFSAFSVSRAGEVACDDPAKPQFVVFDSTDPGNRLAVAAFNGGADAAQLPARAKEFLERHKPEFRAIFITQSGAEGINLRGVRHVHICEPYWNEVRVQQVIGRAARVGSHAALPPRDRNVTVHRYLVAVPPNHNNFTIRNVDKNLSTDQIVQRTARNKMALISAFLDALRSAAVDCEEHCFDQGLAPGSAAAALDDEPDDGGGLATLHVVRDASSGRELLRDPATGLTFDLPAWRERRELVPAALAPPNAASARPSAASNAAPAGASNAARARPRAPSNAAAPVAGRRARPGGRQKASRPPPGARSQRKPGLVRSGAAP